MNRINPSDNIDSSAQSENYSSDTAERERTAQAFEQSEARFREFFETADDVIFTIDLEGNFTSLNRAGERMSGYTREEILKINYAQFVAPESLEVVRRMIAAKLECSEDSTKYEIEVVAKDGVRSTLAVSSRLICVNEKPIGIQGIARDITENKQAAENLRISEQYQNLFKHANDAILIFEPETEIVFEVNDKACEIYRRRREDFVGRSLKEMSQNVTRGAKELQKLLHDGVYDEFESVHLRGDGTPFNLVINAAVIEYQGRLAIMTINRDVTAKKLIEADLRESEERFRSVARSAQDAIVSADSRGKIIFWNEGAEKIFGYNERETVGESLQMIIPAAQREAHQIGLERNAATGENRLVGKTVEVHGRRKNGEGFPLELSLGTWETAKGKFFTAVIRDITERKRAENAIVESERRYRLLGEGIMHQVWTAQPDGKLDYVNQRTLRYFGSTMEQALNDGWRAVVHPDDLSNCAELWTRALETGKDYEVRFRLKNAEGEYRWHLARASAGLDADGNIVKWFGTNTDIDDQHRAEEQLLHDALHDRLTELANRNLFMNHLQKTIERARRNNHSTFAVLLLDFDRFKVVNDSLGHAEGDKFLKLVAQRLKSLLRGGDLVARLGGDEFTILLNELGDESAAVRVAERIQADLRTPFNLGGREVFISASIGITLGAGGHERAEDMLRDADIAMYRAKAKGRAQHQIFDRPMHEHASRQLQLETEMRHALERGEFLLHYQPIINLTTETLMGFEALVRWQHPERGMVPPFEFIGAAEENNLILPLGEWILRESCRQMREWQNSNSAAANLTVSVNLSSKQFSQPDLTDQIADALGAARLDPRCLKLEITESHLMENSDQAITMLDRLRALGVELSLDDFGTGYSSLSYLHRLPVHFLKVDRSFVVRMTESEENSEIVSTIIKLAQSLKMKVVAEGIETAEQLAHLKRLNCEFGQGYYFSKPLEAQAAERFIEENARNYPFAPRRADVGLEINM